MTTTEIGTAQREYQEALERYRRLRYLASEAAAVCNEKWEALEDAHRRHVAA